MVCALSQPNDVSLQGRSAPENVLGGTFSVAYGLRCYSPEMGRWINRDPIGEIGGANLFIFIRNRPLAFLDLLGFTMMPASPVYVDGAFDIGPWDQPSWNDSWDWSGSWSLMRFDFQQYVYDSDTTKMAGHDSFCRVFNKGKCGCAWYDYHAVIGDQLKLMEWSVFLILEVTISDRATLSSVFGFIAGQLGADSTLPGQLIVGAIQKYISGGESNGAGWHLETSPVEETTTGSGIVAFAKIWRETIEDSPSAARRCASIKQTCRVLERVARDQGMGILPPLLEIPADAQLVAPEFDSSL